MTTIRFLLNDQTVETDAPPGMAALDFVRERANLKGTKHACREGDCGACLVLVGTRNDDGVVRYQELTSCLLPLGAVAGRHLVTVEGLAGVALGPVQQAIVDEGASQCGFCTPGFVVAMTGYLLTAASYSTEGALIALAGNLCRCTGYASIRRAMQGLMDDLRSSVESADNRIEAVVAAGILPAYFADIGTRLAELGDDGCGSNPLGPLVAGGSDLYVQRLHTIEGTAPRLLLREIEARIWIEDGFVNLSATTTAEDLKHSRALREILGHIAPFIDVICSQPIRNRATIAGNIVNASPIGDMTIMLLALDTDLVLADGTNRRTLPLRDFYLGYKTLDLAEHEIIEALRFPQARSQGQFNFEKVSKRTYLDIASVNSAAWIELDDDVIDAAFLSAGGVAPIPMRLRRTEDWLRGRPATAATAREAAEMARAEVSPITDVRGSADYKRLSAGPAHPRPLPRTVRPRGRSGDGGFPVKHLDTPAHTRGEARFIADLPEPSGLLHGVAVPSPVPHGNHLVIDAVAARHTDGVVAILTAEDIPGENQIGGIVQDEELLADGEVHFVGQPVALVVAETLASARRGAEAVIIRVDELPGIFDPREAHAKGQLITASRTLECGDLDAAWSRCNHVVDGRVDSGGQEHVYFETQSALAIPQENDHIQLFSATQAPTAVQRITARVLGLPMNAVEVDVVRLGGAFGGKEDQATPWAVLAALAARHTGRPVKIVLSREEDMAVTGKRHPYSSDYKIGLSGDGKILAYEVTYYQNAGAAADLSPAILERSLFHATSSYFIPNVRVTGHSCRTNLPPFTAFRGFGAPQAMFVMESAITRAAEAMEVDRLEIQRPNLLDEGDTFPYGMAVERSQARRSFVEAEERYDVAAGRNQIEGFNRQSRLVKRGMAVMPVCFGISFTSTFLNQASALVHIYTDGSVGVSTAAVEMGQGVNTKIAGIAALTLGIHPRRIFIESTNTTRVANTSPTAASSGADMNGRAAELACASLSDRLTAVAADLLDTKPSRITVENECVHVEGSPTELGWSRLVWEAYVRRVSLSAQAHYATPEIHYDRDTERGRPFAYHVFGAAAIEVTVDCLRGTYTVDRVRIVHDAGRSINPLVDLGQVEGGLMQGIGWMTCEELLFSDGHIASGNLTNYKIPDIMATPEIESIFLEDADNPKAVLHSKAIGEPPLMYGIGTYFALLDAMRAFRPDLPAFFQAPMTPERVLMALYGRD